LTDRSNREKSFKLDINIENEWQSNVKTFRFSTESSTELEEKVK